MQRGKNPSEFLSIGGTGAPAPPGNAIGEGFKKPAAIVGLTPRENVYR